ncbi:tripartite motif-containing protein 16-like [Scomber japonicus]|uniref:tripartite motif-containing protein 16-like n=1 Tax=Scomber japonicus TaxID=13676 RepID=UPI00230693C1|nr:tripartite motif-containing protein 16-like [Scomber japonicus]
MAQQGNQADRVKFCCSICLDLLKDPVTIPCGHNYCMNCIKTFWDGEDQKIHSCPQCRKTFIPRPELVKNTMLAELVEELKKTELGAAPEDHCYAGPEDVACDVCTGRKLKALKSCLVCLASYCEQHLQPHYDSPAFQKHNLADASAKLQDTICSLHNEVMKIFCRTDQQCICILCSMDEHKGHDTISAAAERTEKQKELRVSRQNIQQRIQDREKDVKELQQEMEAINQSADKAVEDSEKIFTELIRRIQKRSSDVKQQIRSKQETEVNHVKELQKKLEKEITELKRKDTELEKLSCTEDHIQFLKKYPSLSGVSGSAGAPRTNIDRLWYFKDVMAAVTAARDKMQVILSEKWPQADPKKRAEFLKCSGQITLDPNTANNCLVLSDRNRKITHNDKNIRYPHHPDRFIHAYQVLSKDGLTGRCYWEVERSGSVGVAVAYNSIGRSGNLNAHAFGYNDKSWVLHCGNSYVFRHNKIGVAISGPQSSRIGVYLDHSAGVLSFYSISDTTTLLHRVQTTFTQPLYAGLYLSSNGDTAEFCELKQTE